MGKPWPSTFSVVAHDPETRDLGVAVHSNLLAVGAVVLWAQADVGAVATQARANVRYGPEGLAQLPQRLSAAEALERLLAADPDAVERQIGIADVQGQAAAFTKRRRIPWAGVVGDGFCCQGNILAGLELVPATAEAYQATAASFPLRLLAAQEAGQAAGGDARGQQSAALLVVRPGGGYDGSDRAIETCGSTTTLSRSPSCAASSTSTASLQPGAGRPGAARRRPAARHPAPVARPGLPARARHRHRRHPGRAPALRQRGERGETPTR